MSSKHDTGGLSFREKSLVLTVVANAAVYAFYFWRAFAIGEGDPTRVTGLFASTVVLLAAVMIAKDASQLVYYRRGA